MPAARKKNELPFVPVSRETVQDHVYGRLKEFLGVNRAEKYLFEKKDFDALASDLGPYMPYKSAS